MGFPKLVKCHLYIESAPRVTCPIFAARDFMRLACNILRGISIWRCYLICMRIAIVQIRWPYDNVRPLIWLPWLVIQDLNFKTSSWAQHKIKTETIKLQAHKHFIVTHWGWDKTVNILQMTFSNAFSLIRMYEFCLQFHCSLFLGVQLTMFQHWFR